MKIDDLPKSTAEVLEEIGFKRGTAYMPVPRCDECKHWTGDYCYMLSDDIDEKCLFRCGPDFGCVKFEAE